MPTRSKTKHTKPRTANKATARRSTASKQKLMAHCTNPTCAKADLGVHATRAAAAAAIAAHAETDPGHITVVGTNLWDAKCFTDQLDLADGTSAGAAMAAANKHLADHPDHDVQVWQQA